MILLAVGAGAVWAATAAGVVRVDPASNRVTATLPDDHPPWAAAAGSLWSVDCTRGTGPCDPLRLDPRNLHATARFPLPGALAVDDDTLWLLEARGRCGGSTCPARGWSGCGCRRPTSASSRQLAIGEGAVWVLTNVERPTPLGSRVDAGLVRIDPHTNRVSATTPLANLDSDPYSARLAVGAGGVWVESQQRSQDGLAHVVIFRVDPASGRLRGTIATGDLSPAALAAGLGALWLLRPTAGALLRLDPAAM